MEGVLYCKPHFEQLYKESGNFNKNFLSRMPFYSYELYKQIHYLYVLCDEYNFAAAAKSADQSTPMLVIFFSQLAYGWSIYIVLHLI